MSQVLNIKPDQEFIYRVDILRVFKGGDHSRWGSYPWGSYPRTDSERERLEAPELIETAFHNTPRAARNYGSYRTGRAKWYNNMNKEADQGAEPALDYKVYEIPIALAMGEVREIPQLKRLYELT